jgi:hypothetical protein
MNMNAVKMWEIAGGTVLIAGVAALGTWHFFLRKRPTPAEIELGRRQFLTQNGRIVDGTLLDVAEVAAADGTLLTMLFYEYRIGGVDYEASQDITLMGDVVTVAHVRSGFPCSVRYQPGSPQNSIVVAERWSGLRQSVPYFPNWDEHELHMSHEGPSPPPLHPKPNV